MDARRRTLLTAGAAGAAALVSGCGDGGGDSASETPTPTTPKTPTGTPTGSAQAGTALAKIADIPVEGGRVFVDQKVVVTQPNPGEFKAFSAICTHQRCLVKTIAAGTIDCPCHGSKFRITDGSVEVGPATEPLPEKQITVSGDSIQLI
ncbi:Rieske (2Fe-2S) protein [Streptomyces sp. ISL-1]|uniref:Rieske (2Fe-2S) protein n=1 Tax=Streptomyces sp. ISL-1 TaxID=2817657 RepID=UPI001BEB9526|nr:Rieske (2Fe-2S) protein [Streptomyces sp. ISL-1]MBT2389486.1 Rieske (2Fe-2S) protein [Streptomyces sp. ISL-1]